MYNDEERHGSPTFYSLLDEMADTHSQKSHDYASNENPYGNYHFAGQVSSMFASSPEDAGFVGRLAEKIYRLANLQSSGKTPKNESISDTERDIAVITALWMADRRDRRLAQNKVELNTFTGESRQIKHQFVGSMSKLTPHDLMEIQGMVTELLKIRHGQIDTQKSNQVKND